MNRIYLIGNGFDLAHGLKTSYHDFMLWYLKSSILTAFKHGLYKDRVWTITRNHALTPETILSLENVSDLLSFCSHGLHKMLSPASTKHESSHGPAVRLETPKYFVPEIIARCCNYKWVDIENEYYKYLKKSLEADESKRDDYLERLNGSLSQMKIKLEEYVSTLTPAKKIIKYNHIIAQPFNPGDFTSKAMTVKSPVNNLILNFNYTKTASLYAHKIAKNTTLINVHGQTGDNINPIIFGYGDEIDKSYALLEDEGKEGAFTHIKSFYYFHTENYRNLIRFTESGRYQVFILGHACGRSDRTMLNMLFENVNCRSIKIFYHEWDGGDNYTEITQEISRHFTGANKGEMRKKIVSKENSETMPQIS